MTGQPVNNFVLQQYKKQRSRGTEGFGIFDGQENNMVHEAHEDKIMRWLKRYKSDILMFHHRNPTSTINVKRACHPFSTKDFFGDTEYVLIHNGYIWNADDLFVEHSERGINYQSLLEDLTFNDSEALLWDFALYMEGHQLEMEARGGIAFICMKLVKGKLVNLYFDRNTNPLRMKHNKNGLFLSSEGKGQSTTPDLLYKYEYETDKLTTTSLPLENYSKSRTAWKYSSVEGSPDDTYSNHIDKNYGYLWNSEQQSFISREKQTPKKIPEKIEPSELRPIVRADWLSDELCKKFGVTPVRKVIEFEEQEGGGMAPIEKVVENLPLNFPESAENIVISSLVKHNGVFEKAYWSIERRYVKEYAKAQTEQQIDHINLLEKALELISMDEEYKNERSVSSIWQALWNQKGLA